MVGVDSRGDLESNGINFMEFGWLLSERNGGFWRVTGGES